MATESDKTFLAEVEERLSKLGKNPLSALDLLKDYATDKGVQLAPQALVSASGKLEQGRRFLQQGSVPGAAAKLARAKAATAAAGGFLGGARKATTTQAAIELAKGAYLIGTEGAREGHAEAGKQLIKEPLAYQAANLFVSPADALSKYGAAREAAGKKTFEDQYINSLIRQVAAEEERKARSEQSNRDVPAIEIQKGTQPNPRKFFK